MIDQAFGWLGQLAEFFGSLFPRLTIVKTSHRALKYRHGKNLILLQPGLHLYWPLVTELEWASVVQQVIVHAPHVLETADGVPVVAGGITVYQVSDPLKYLAENEDPDAVIDDVAAAAIRQVVVTHRYAELGTDLAAIDTELTAASRSLLRSFGVRVIRTRLTDLARTRPLHLTGIPPSPHPHDEHAR